MTSWDTVGKECLACRISYCVKDASHTPGTVDGSSYVDPWLGKELDF